MAENADAIELFERFLTRAITGQVSMTCRKRLARGETMTVQCGKDKVTINIDGDRALLRRGSQIVLERPFVPWGEADDDYEAMVESFGEDGSVSEEWCQRASTNFHCRFE
ncbi:MAG: hypothetical protein CVV05_01585 [Gammaproteobacteria bacterium HGW-Gammaproteobacteria-1]|nr:MAG: hypothetical protein CVV05_01585 [Gammaproteobacteria bacterium HGW-Gammaproteobacteria-1]